MTTISADFAQFISNVSLGTANVGRIFVDSGGFMNLSGLATINGITYQEPRLATANWANYTASANVVIPAVYRLNASGAINVTGLASLSAANIQNALNVSGLATLSGATIRNKLNVIGLTTLSGQLNVAGVSKFSNVFV